MAHILITGSAAGLGLGAARELADQGHDVILHARSARRAHGEPEAADLLERGARLVTGDLADPDQVRSLVHQVERLGAVDAIIHNAGVLNGPAILPVNVVAPYVLTALLPAQRLVFLSSGMHRGGRPTLEGLDWSGARRTASYSDSKLLVTTLAAAVGRIRPDVPSNAVDPGWVPTRMGGAGAPDDLELGHRTQAWLAAGEDPATRVSAYWFHQRRRDPHPSTRDERFQDELLDALALHTGVRLTR